MFTIDFSAEAHRNIAGFKPVEQRVLIEAMEAQLAHQPHVETRNRKRLRTNKLAQWELRVHRFRVFYEVDEARRTVGIVAIGVKERNYLLIGGKEFKIS